MIGKDEDGNDVSQSWWKFRDSIKNGKPKMQAITELSSGPSGLKIKINDPIKSIKALSEMEVMFKEDEKEKELKDVKDYEDFFDELLGK